MRMNQGEGETAEEMIRRSALESWPAFFEPLAKNPSPITFPGRSING